MKFTHPYHSPHFLNPPTAFSGFCPWLQNQHIPFPKHVSLLLHINAETIDAVSNCISNNASSFPCHSRSPGFFLNKFVSSVHTFMGHRGREAVSCTYLAHNPVDCGSLGWFCCPLLGLLILSVVSWQFNCRLAGLRWPHSYLRLLAGC